MNADFGKYNKVKLIKKTENSVALEFSIPATSPYYNGHFPDLPILPGVAQVDLVVHFASEHFGISIGISKINRIKFINIIRPENPFVLFIEADKIEADKKNIAFKFSSPGGETVYSSGTMTINQY